MALDPQILDAIKQAVASGELNLQALSTGRSPVRPRQLHDLRLLPTKDDPRPTFFWSVEGPRDMEAGKTFPYPRLLWSVDGTEVRVENKKEHDAHLSQGYLEYNPGTAVLDPSDAIRAMLEKLSPADRDLVVNGAKAAKIKALQEQMLALSDADLDTVLASMEPAKSKKSA
jgi:hypothetical protein